MVVVFSPVIWIQLYSDILLMVHIPVSIYSTTSTLLFPQWDKITLTPHNSMNRGILVADWLICIFSNRVIHLDKEICFQYQPEK